MADTTDNGKTDEAVEQVTVKIPIDTKQILKKAPKKKAAKKSKRKRSNGKVGDGKANTTGTANTAFPKHSNFSHVYNSQGNA